MNSEFFKAVDLIEQELLERDRTHSLIHVYIKQEKDALECVEFIKARLDAEGIEYETSIVGVNEEDWANNWKQYFHQFYVDDILIIPSWEDVKPEDEDKMIIHIDPGTAFGTGMHETTQLCIRQLRKFVNEDTTILDVGCGSGILGMLALKFGAKYSVGTDLDPCAIEATYENMEVNGITKDQYEVMIGNIIDDKEVQDRVGYEKYDIVVANILAGKVVQGASTLTQQLSRILFLSNEKTFTRKIKELQVAAQIEKTISKDKILEMYLNNVYLGSGAYGVKGAAKIYFNKNLDKL